MDMIEPVNNSFDALMNLATKAQELINAGKLPHIQDGKFERKADTDVATLIFYLPDYASVKLTVTYDTPVGYAIVDIKYPQRRKADELAPMADGTRTLDDIWKTSIDFSAKDSVDTPPTSAPKGRIPESDTFFKSIGVTPTPRLQKQWARLWGKSQNETPLTTPIPEDLRPMNQRGATGGGAGSVFIHFVLPPVPCPLESIWMILDAVASGKRINERTWQIDNEYENEEY